MLICFMAVLVTMACDHTPQDVSRTRSLQDKAMKLQTTTDIARPIRPAIDRAAPTGLETASFALG